MADEDTTHQEQVARLVNFYGLDLVRGAKMLENCPTGRRGRYLVFGHDSYYPGGGLSDVYFDTDSLDDAKEAAGKMRNETVYIYDRIDDVETEVR